MINQVTLLGYLGKDPEFKALTTDNMVGKVSIATTEKWRDKDGNLQEKTEWHSLVLWGNNAKNAQKLLKKGSLIFAQGKLTHRTVEGDDNITRYYTEVVVNEFKLLSGGIERDTGSSPTQPPSNYDPPAIKATDVATAEDDKLPF